MFETVQVEGLAELNRSLRKLSSDAPKALRVGLNSVADMIVKKIRPKIPRRTGRAAGSLAARSTRTAARIGVGGARAPWYPWLDFGGRTGRNRSVERRFLKEGRYVYPTLSEERVGINKDLTKTLTGVIKDAGLEVS